MESQENLLFVDRLFERISQAAIKASPVGKEKGSYPLFEGSGWQTRNFPDGAIRETAGNGLPQRQPREMRNASV